MQCMHFMHSCMQCKCLCKCCLKVCRRSHRDKTQKVLKFTVKCQSILLNTKEDSPHTVQYAQACKAWALFKRNKESCPFLVPRQSSDEEISTSQCSPRLAAYQLILPRLAGRQFLRTCMQNVVLSWVITCRL